MKRPMKKPMAPVRSMRPKAKPADMSSMQAMQRGENAAKREAEDYKTLAKKMKTGGKIKMVEKNGKKVPFFAADGAGKMNMGGMCRGMGAASKGGKYKA